MVQNKVFDSELKTLKFQFASISDDCFDDMEEPLYGFIVEVTVSENETCSISDFGGSSLPQCQILQEDNLDYDTGSGT